VVVASLKLEKNHYGHGKQGEGQRPAGVENRQVVSLVDCRVQGNSGVKDVRQPPKERLNVLLGNIELNPHWHIGNHHQHLRGLVRPKHVARDPPIQKYQARSGNIHPPKPDKKPMLLFLLSSLVRLARAPKTNGNENCRNVNEVCCVEHARPEVPVVGTATAKEAWTRAGQKHNPGGEGCIGFLVPDFLDITVPKVKLRDGNDNNA